MKEKIEEIINKVGYEYKWEISPQEATSQILALFTQESNRIKAEVEKLLVTLSYGDKHIRLADVLKIVSMPNTTDSELKEDLGNLATKEKE